MASIIEDSSRTYAYDSHHFVNQFVEDHEGGQHGSEGVPGSPVIREHQHQHMYGDSNHSPPEDSVAFAVPPGERGHVIQPQGFRIETVGDALDSSIQHPAGGGGGGGTIFSRPVSIGLRLADPGKGLDLETAAVAQEGFSVTDGASATSGGDGGDITRGMPAGFPEYVMSAKRSVSEGDMDSDLGDTMSPIIHDDNARAPAAFKTNRALPGSLPVQIEMSAMAQSTSASVRADQESRSRMRAFSHSGAGRSLFHSNSQSAYQQRSRGDIPSVLLSILRQENIDYENDFYWLTQFHAEKRRDPTGLEKSLLVHSPRPLASAGAAGGLRGRNRMGSSSRLMGASGTYSGTYSGGAFAAQRSHSRTPPPAFAADRDRQPFSPGVDMGLGMSASGLDSSVVFSGSQQLPSDPYGGNESPPRYPYRAASGMQQQQQPGWRPAGQGSGHSSAAFVAGRVHGPAAGQRKSVSGLDCLAESDDVED